MDSLSIRAQECLSALNQYRACNTLSEERNPNPPLPHLAQLPNHAENFQRDLTVPSGSQVALLFATEAAKQLSLQQFRQLVQFLRDPMNGNTQDKQILEQALENRLQEFYSAEVEISGGDRTRLAAPGGPPDAALGLILHVQSEDDTIEQKI
ncbi:MAG: hypothetical protein M1820_003580 [Bogoriella megaspora]|nr:MAG: hypothetical protein M1820_003580 [Bogoriella megaspora]